MLALDFNLHDYRCNDLKQSFAFKEVTLFGDAACFCVALQHRSV